MPKIITFLLFENGRMLKIPFTEDEYKIFKENYQTIAALTKVKAPLIDLVDKGIDVIVTENKGALKIGLVVQHA